jgi:chemotaxis protein MotA
MKTKGLVCPGEAVPPEPMFAIIGIVVVFGAVLGGYLLEHGSVLVLLQPAELLIIAGAASGTVLIANPLYVLKRITAAAVHTFKGSEYSRSRYLASLKLGYQLLNKARRQGLMALESDIEDPDKSTVFSQDPDFLKDPHVRAFFCDSMRMAISGVEAYELDQLIDLDLEVQHHDAMQPVNSMTTVADSLPGLGIVAAVLGVVITMQALGGPPEEIGRKVAAALVGTFLGVLLCYGLVGPIASNMAKLADEERSYLNVLRVLIISFLKGTAPILAVEAARRACPSHVRPTFQELEDACRGRGAAETAPESPQTTEAAPQPEQAETAPTGA